MVFRFPFDSRERYPLPPDYFLEPSVGALWMSPMLVAALLVPSARRLAKHSGQNTGIEIRFILWTITASSAAILIFLLFTHLATHRYETDFVALGTLAAVTNLTLYVCESTNYRKVLLSAIVEVLIGYSIVTNLALGLAGPYDDILKNRPASYLRIAAWFSPIRRFRPVMNPKISADLAVKFVPQPPGYREPLLPSGILITCTFSMSNTRAELCAFSRSPRTRRWFARSGIPSMHPCPSSSCFLPRCTN